MKEMIRKIKAAVLAFLVTMLALLPTTVNAELSTLSDAELSAQSGQALFLMDKITGTGTSGTSGTGENGITFYKMGLDAVLDINANIKKLQLGCGGVNGPGCDIDIDNLSLSGPESCAGGRVNCSAQLVRPFVQFAIKGDDNPATRQIVGYRLSAEEAIGLLSAGYQDASQTRDQSRSGINSLSGYMNLASASGTGTTAQRNMTQADAGQLTGRVNINYYLFSGMSDFYTNNYTIQVNPSSASFVTAPTQISGKRMTAANLLATATVNDITIQCPPGQTNQCLDAYASALGGLNLKEGVAGTIRGVKAAVRFSQALNLIHKIPVNNPFSLSMQAQDVLWPGAAAQAKTGWWMAFEDPIDIGNVSASDPIQITNAVLQQLVGPINTVLYNNPPSCAALNCLTGTTLNTGVINLSTYFSNPANYLDMPLSDLKLSAQNVLPNCRGSAKFC